MNMRRETRKSKKSKNAINSLLSETIPEGSGAFVEELEAVEVKTDPPILKDRKRSPTVSDIQAIQLAHESEIKKLKAELASSGKTPLFVDWLDLDLNKNERKLISAIRSEALNQNTEEPVMGRSLLKNRYKINQRYLDDAVKSLMLQGVIERKSVRYSKNITTFSWTILKSV